ncbi:hypothetical protein ABN763_08550 [Spongiivirga sp. MCCC 1A20706]|uniref:hypothetical protein n=1 Tax=Spongiivirga sp. MCCC 1A20706 TaxID=3160963 RepID=UPI00397792BA
MADISHIATIEKLSDEALFKIITLERGLYKKEVIAIAETTFKKRRLSLKDFQKKYNFDLVAEVKNRLKYGENLQDVILHFKDRDIELSQNMLNSVNQKLTTEERLNIGRKLVVYSLVTLVFIVTAIANFIGRSILGMAMGIIFVILSISMLIIIYRLVNKKTTAYSLDSI